MSSLGEFGSPVPRSSHPAITVFPLTPVGQAGRSPDLLPLLEPPQQSPPLPRAPEVLARSFFLLGGYGPAPPIQNVLWVSASTPLVF